MLTDTTIHNVTNIRVNQRLGDGFDGEPFWCTDIDIITPNGSIRISCHDEARAQVTLMEDRSKAKVGE